MRGIKSIFLVILLFVGESVNSQSTSDSVSIANPTDTLQTDSLQLNNQESKADSITRAVWVHKIYLNANKLSSDSLFRWMTYQHLDEYLLWETDHITFRTGSLIGPSFQINPAQAQSDAIIDGTTWGFPLGTYRTFQHLDMNRIDSLNYDLAGDLEIKNQRPLRLKPLTIIKAEESDFGYLNVSTSLYVPISNKHHLQIGLLNQAETGAYSRSAFENKLLSAHYRYQLSDYKQLEFQWSYQSYQTEQADGYDSQTVFQSGFNRFDIEPRRSNAQSSLRNANYRLDYFNEKSKWFQHSSAYFQMGRRFFKSTYDSLDTENVFRSDSVKTEYRQFGLYNATQMKFLGSDLHYSLNLDINDASQRNYALSDSLQSNLDGKVWLTTSFNGDLKREFDWAQLLVGRTYSYNTLTGLSGKVKYELVFENEKSNLHLDVFSQIIQQPVYSKFWRSASLSGAKLKEIYHFGSGLKWRSKLWVFNYSLGLRGSYQTGGYGIRDQTFYKTKDYFTYVANGSIDWTSKRFSVYTDVQFVQFVGQLGFWGTQSILRNRTKFYFQDYFFNKAAFIKFGFATLFSQFSINAPLFDPVTEHWYQASTNSNIAGFFRADFEMTARVRQLFFYLRWENITQGLLQNGYFEQYPYPMFPRRLRIGVKTYLNN